MKFIIGLLITIGLLIFVFVLIFTGGDNTKNQTTKQASLADYSTSSTVVMQFTTEGPVNADQSHRSVRISVGSSASTIEVINGYQGTVVNSKSYVNNPTAYADFLKALDYAGFNLGNTDPKLTDIRGRCATGKRYILGIMDGSHQVQNLWSTTCGGGATSKAKVAAIDQLFQDQIPDYGRVVNGVF